MGDATDKGGADRVPAAAFVTFLRELMGVKPGSRVHVPEPQFVGYIVRTNELMMYCKSGGFKYVENGCSISCSSVILQSSIDAKSQLGVGSRAGHIDQLYGTLAVRDKLQRVCQGLTPH